ncbi:bacitracin ABC transporter ATP-binding protein, partial [Enterococcus hirae]
DEPTNGLDPAGIQEMRSLIRDLPAQRVTVLLSSHLLSEVELVADHLVILHRGRRVFQGASRDLQARRRGQLEIGVERLEAA